ncbi:MAG: hypothetical protein C0407_07050 [Desulfobacca sp.]|nr:hypothetical protein [Desulfobacca sp.]
MNHRLFDRFPGTRKKHERWIRTICQECSVRCGLIAYLQQGAVVDVHGDDKHPVSRGRLCARGLAFIQGLDNPARITTPTFRNNLQEPFAVLEDWEKALDLFAEQLRKSKDHHGAESIVIACDPEADLDFAIGAVRFAALFGTPHVYHPVDFPDSLSRFSLPFYPVSPCYEWGHSQALFLIEADLATTHPIAFGWALEAQQQGVKLIAADSRFTRTMAKSDLALRIPPHTGNNLGLALMKTALEGSDFNNDFAKARFLDPEFWRASFDRLSWEALENTLGLTPKSLNQLNDLLPGSHPITIVTGKRLATLPNYGIWPTLMTAMGWSETKGSGWYPLAGTTPPIDATWGMADGLAQKDPHHKETPPLKTIEDLRDLIDKDQVSARAILYSGDCLTDLLPFLQGLPKGPDLMAGFGAFPNRLQGLSHILFPSTLWAEKDGLCFSNDRAAQWAEKILEPPAGCRSGLDFWLGLAKRFGWEKAFPWSREDGSTDQESFYQWVLEKNAIFRGCSLDPLRDSSQVTHLCFWSWDEKGKDEKINPFPAPEALELSSRSIDQEHFPLIFQKTPFVARSGEAGSYWPWTQKLEEEEAVQIHPETAGILHIENGDAILISSPAKTWEARAWISRMVPSGMVASPRDSGGDWVLVHKTDQTSEEALTLLNAQAPLGDKEG